MAIKSEIAWSRRTPEGDRLEVYARRFGGEWRFYHRVRRHDEWKPAENPPLEDWIALLDAIQRRVPRRLFPPTELHRVRQEALRRFPEAGPEIGRPTD